jgi:hypothetical protein
LISRDQLATILKNKEALTVLIFTGLSVVGGLVGNRLLTSYAAPNELGQLYLYTNLAQWLTLPTAGGFIYITHHWPIARAHNVAGPFARAIVRGLAIQAAVIVIGSAMLQWFAPALKLSSGVTFWLVLLAIGTSVFQALVPIPNAERMRLAAGILNMWGGPLRQFALAAAIGLLAVSTSKQLLTISAAFQLIAAGVAAIIVIRIMQRVHASTNAEPVSTPFLTFKAFLSYTIPGLLGALAGQAATSAERWGLARLDEPATTALFVQAAGISSAATGAIASVFTTYFYPLITQAAAKTTDPLGGAGVQLKRFLALAVLGQVVVVAMASVFARQIGSLAFGARFAGVTELLPWTMLGAALFSIGQALTIVLFTARDAVWPNATRVVSQLAYAAGLILLPHSGNLGTRFAQYFVLGQTLYVALVVLAIFRVVRQRQQQIRQSGGSPC